MEHLTDNYWSERYKDASTGWDIGAPSRPLKYIIDQLTNKELRILIPGCGNAYEAEYLHAQGFKNVYVADWAKEPLEAFHKRVQDFPKEHLLHIDFFELQQSFDLVLEQTFFCAIDPKIRAKYVEKMHEILGTNGSLEGVLFQDTLNSDKPPFGGSKEEYYSLFNPYFTIDRMEVTEHSEPARSGRELMIKLTKKHGEI